VRTVSEEQAAPVIALTAHGRCALAVDAGRPVAYWSIAKVALAAAALALVERGALALDDPLSERPYNLRQLLQHTSGLRDYGAAPAYHAAVAAGASAWSIEEMLSRASAERLLFKPGEGWSYSNIGYLFVRRLIEETYRGELDDALDALVFAPLGVRGVRLARSRAELVGVDNARRGYDPGWVYHGLLVGPAIDAATTLDGVLTGPLLSPETRREMMRPHPIDARIAGRPFRPPSYGLGLLMGGQEIGCAALGHTGGGPGGVSAVYHFPDSAPARTAALFAPWEDPDAEGRLERQALALALAPLPPVGA
jgi:CubicO group peptidase (beta-lactamase class C family)